ncbi:MAG: deoxyuridine 5'-triphosphate nucleotidohydrolase [Nitrososphaeria archaeon]|nr:deoxyuridine 5'-triphosphate nucleotidohydrolase [Nitrososphaeria archaeon]
MSVLSGEDVANYLENISREQVQVNGVDLTVERIFRLNGVGIILCNDVRLPEYVEVKCDNGKFFLEKGVYVVQVKERISIPLDTVGICLPRSSLVRMGVQVGSALWDSGYVGYSKILLNVGNPIIIEKGARFAQLVLIRCEKKANEGYRGRYQNEQ